MKRMRKLGLSLVAVLTAVSLVACGGSSKKDPKDIIAKAVKEVDKIDYLEANMSIEIGMKAKSGKQKASIEMGIDGTVTYDFKKERAKSVMEGSMKGAGKSQDVEMQTYVYADEDDDYYGTYTMEDDEWEYEDDVETDTVRPPLLDGDTLKDVLDSSDTVYKGEGKVEDKKTYILESEISFDDFKEIALSQFSDTEDSIGSLDSLGDLDMDLTVQFEFYQDSGNIAAYSVDMKDELDKVLKKAAKKSSSDASIEITAYKISIQYVSFDKQKIELPEDAEEAMDGSGSGGGRSEGNDDATGPWRTSQEVKIGDKAYSIPFNFSELEAEGYVINDRSLESKTLGSEKTEYSVDVTKDGKKMSLKFYNPNLDAKALKECQVIGVSVDGLFDEDDELIPLELPGGVKIGMSEKDFLATYKEYSSLYEGSLYTSYDFNSPYDDDLSIHCTVEVSTETGKVISVSYDIWP